MTLIFSESELDELLTAAGSSKMVVLFCGLTWCRPCKGMQRPFQKMAAHYPALACIKLFGNANVQTKRLFKDRLRVRSTPSFIFFVDGKQVRGGGCCGAACCVLLQHPVWPSCAGSSCAGGSRPPRVCVCGARHQPSCGLAAAQEQLASMARCSTASQPPPHLC